jgi:hypothetical protein
VLLEGLKNKGDRFLSKVGEKKYILQCLLTLGVRNFFLLEHKIINLTKYEFILTLIKNELIRS